MRLSVTTLITLSLFTGCGAKYKPGTAVISGWDRTQTFAEDEASTVAYSGHAMVAPPVIPMIAFGAAFDLDVVVKSRHPEWDMHEWARISTPEGPMWVAVESRRGTLDQVLVADVEHIDAWMPELPMARKSTPMKVVDRSTNDELDVTITYENMDNEEVEVSVLGNPPHRFQKKRNGNTLGHSANQAMAVVDIAHRESLFKVAIKHDGSSTGVAKVGIVPFQFAMEQVQGGLAVGSFYTRPQN
jgi:hypothetical protein